MSDRLTSIHLPRAGGSGIADWGERTASEMIALIRARAAYLREIVEAIDAASDDEFQIQSYTGVHVQKKRREIQHSSRL